MQVAAARHAAVAAWLRPAFSRPVRAACSSLAGSNITLHERVICISGRHARRMAAAAAAADQAAAAPEEQLGGEADSGVSKQRAGKRKVAMFVGYEGTEYRGLQMQPSQAVLAPTVPEATIEDCLEEAVFRAGGILPSNRGQLSKVSWSRSSRTDKSVHSLATVVGLKMEVEPQAFDTDPEGLALAAGINQHLPPEVRVFSIQRVSKSWNARSECIRRSYTYYLPASLLGLALDGGQRDADRLELLRAAWELFQGTHPFHNYTKRRLYREAEGGKGRRRPTRAEQDALAGPGPSSGLSSEGDESDAEAEEERGAPEGIGAPVAAATDAAVAFCGDGQQDGTAAEAGAGERKRQVNLQWKHDKDSADLVVRRHFRFIEWCQAATEVKSLVPGGEPCIQLSLQGGSFMLHQIRHMVGMAVAVARGNLPIELVEASLATPARMNLPLAPPCSLMLTGAQFSPFKRSWSGDAAVASQWSGEALELREQGVACQQRFLEGTMLPALSALLAGDEWAQWAHDLDATWCDGAELAELLSTHTAWREARRQARADAVLAEAAAAQGGGAADEE